MYRAIEDFADLQDNRYSYKTGDVFPRDGLKVSAERIKELATKKNRRKRPVIKEFADPVKETEAAAETVEAEVSETKKPKKRGQRNAN